MTHDLSMPSLYGPDRPVRLNTLVFPEHLRVIVLGPHPDDFDAIGVTMRLFLGQGHFIAAAVLSSADAGGKSARPRGGADRERPVLRIAGRSADLSAPGRERGRRTDGYALQPDLHPELPA